MHIVKVQSSMDIRDATGLGTLILIHGVILVINSCQISLTLSESLEELSHKPSLCSEVSIYTNNGFHTVLFRKLNSVLE